MKSAIIRNVILAKRTCGTGGIYIKEKPLDTRPFGQALKEERLKRNLTRSTVAEMLNIAPRYLMAIENDGQHPSLQVFYNLASLFEISVDKFFFDRCTNLEKEEIISKQLTGLSDGELEIVLGTIEGIKRARKKENTK